MRASEFVAAFAFLFYAVVPWFGDVPFRRRLRVTGVSVLMLLAVNVVSHSGALVRDSAPVLYILVGYYLSGWLFVRPSAATERWLLGWDHRLLGDPTTRFSHWPAAFLAYLDAVYTGCFLLLPSGFATLALTGHSDVANRYWTVVTAAELGAFMPLAFIQTRPPWVLERRADLPDSVVHRMAEQAVRNVSIGVNTFPSGHAAGSLGIALALAGVAPIAGVCFLLISASICVACVVGRYHYVIDVVAGIALALGVWAVTIAIGI